MQPSNHLLRFHILLTRVDEDNFSLSNLSVGKFGCHSNTEHDHQANCLHSNVQKLRRRCLVTGTHTEWYGSGLRHYVSQQCNGHTADWNIWSYEKTSAALSTESFLPATCANRWRAVLLNDSEAWETSVRIFNRNEESKLLTIAFWVWNFNSISVKIVHWI